MAPPTINIKERYNAGEVDLSMSDLYEVPVKALATLPKIHTLDLSNNHLESLPANFCTLNNLVNSLVILNLGQNKLQELPENFGDLYHLKHLDLYQNELQYLPLSFANLKALKWLDLKDNPLVPAVAKVAGPCLDGKECQECARNIVNFFGKVAVQVDETKQKKQKHKASETKVADIKKANKKNKKKKSKEVVKAAGDNIDNVAFLNSNLHEGSEEGGLERNEKCVGKKHFPWFTVCLFTSLLAIFVLTSVQCTYTEAIETRARNMYNGSFDLLPQDYHEYLAKVGSFVGNVHNRTGDLTLEFLDAVKTNGYFIQICDLLQNVKDKLLKELI